MYRNSLRGALLASTAFVMFGSGPALAQAGGACTTLDGAQVCEGDQPTVNAYGFGLDSFTNTGTLNSAYLFLYRGDTPFTFLNSATGIISTGTGTAPSVGIFGSNLTSPFDVASFVNEGFLGSTAGAAVLVDSSVAIGSFDNSGTIAATGEGHAAGGCFFAEDYGVEIQGNVGAFNNSGTITGTDTGVHIAVVSGNFTNSGLIAATGGEAFGDTGVRLGSVEGNFTNAADGVISGFNYGVSLATIGGNFTNHGRISGAVEAVSIGSLDGDFLNFGTIESTENHTAGATWIGYLGGNFVNGEAGQILSEDHGLLISTTGGDSFLNAGLISSRYAAIQIGQSASDYQFTNTGDILASEGDGVTLGGGYGAGAESQRAGAAFSSGFSSLVTFNNEGNIIAGTTGVLAFSNLASFSNSGLIDGGFAGVSLYGEIGSFSNTGDIIAGVAGVEIRYLSGDFANHGLIEAVRGYTSRRQAVKQGESVPYFSRGIGVSGDFLMGDFTNAGDIRAATTGVSIYALGGQFINQGLIESTTLNDDRDANRPASNTPAGAASSFYSDYAVDIFWLGSGIEIPFNAGVGSDAGLEDVSFFNDASAEIIGAGGGVRIHNLLGSGFVNDGLISSLHDAVTVGSGYTDYVFSNSGTIVSTLGTGVSLGLARFDPVQEPLDMQAGVGGEYSLPATLDFLNTGTITAGWTGVEIGANVGLFRNDGTISGGEYGVNLDTMVDGFANNGLISASGIDRGSIPSQAPFAALDLPGLSGGDAVWLGYVSGGVVNGEDGVIDGARRGIAAFLVETGLLNYGAISGGDMGVSVYSLAGDFLNDGLIEQTGLSDNYDAAAVLLVYFDGEEGFYNSANGEISSDYAGVQIIEFLGGNFYNDGLISAVGDGVTVNYVGGERAFENLGDIISTEGAGVVLAHYAGGGGGGGGEGMTLAAEGAPTDLTFLNTGNILSSVLGVGIEGFVSLFENRGTITGGKVGVDLDGEVEMLTNYGSVTGDQTAIRIGDNLGFLHNAGSMTGLTGGDSGTGAGLRVYGDSGTGVMNAAGGAISGYTGVALGDGGDSFANAGVLTGTGGVAASLAGGDDSFVSIGTGTISGSIDGGADYDTFIASGSQTLDMAIENFEEIWLVAGDISFGRDQSADLILARSDSLDLAGFTFTGDVLSTGELYATGGTIDGRAVNFGSILALDLTITGDLYNGGVINPGGTATLGTLTVLGDFYALNVGDLVDIPGSRGDESALAAATLSPSSSTLVFNFSGLNHDQIIVTGNATLGGDLLVTGNLGEAMKARQDFTLISSASMSGNYNLLNIGGVLFTPEIGQVGTKLLLSFAQNNFVASLAPQTVNQSQAALGLENRWDLGASAADDIILALNAGAAAAPILEAFAPETSAALTRQSARIGSSLAQTVANCATGSNAGACGRRASEGGVMIWTNVSASGAELGSDGNAARVDEAFSQISSGAEYAFGDRFAGGVFLASGSGDVDIADGQRGHGEIDSVAGGLYARMQAGRFTFAGLAGYADTDIEARRQTPLGTSIGETGGSVSFARLDARLTLVSGASHAGFAMSGSYAYAEIGNYAQRGADGYDLDIVGDSFRVEDWELRGFFDHRFEPGQSGMFWSFGGTAGLVLANGEDTASVAASFPGATAVYEGLGPRSDDTGVVAGGFVDLTSPLAGVSAQLGVEGRWMDGEDSSRLYGRFAWKF